MIVAGEGQADLFRNVEIQGQVIQALVFDKDGTLVDTEKVWYASYQRLLAKYGLTHDLITHRKQMSGSAETCVRILQEAHPGTDFAARPLEELIPLRIAMFREAREEIGVVPMDGVEGFLQFCLDHGIVMAVATSAHRGDTDRELEGLGWSRYFNIVVTGDEVSRHKPAPDIFLEAAQRLGLAPSACAAFEDSGPGVKSAHAAGMFTVFMRDPHFEIEPPPEAHLVVPTFRAFREYIRVA